MEIDTLSPLTAISPTDGRFGERTKNFRHYFSEAAYFKYRLIVEINYLIALSSQKRTFKLSSKQKEDLLKLVDSFTVKEAEKIKEYEAKTNHDMKALEYYIKEKADKIFGKNIEYIHFGLTSDDINNLGYGLMIKDALKKEIIPKIEELELALKERVTAWETIVMVARTHGQPAVPTTLGKEIANFVYRLNREFKILKDLKISGKINGAVGNYNALQVAYPEIDWIKFSKGFVASLGLEPVLLSTQIEGYDHLVEVFDCLKRFNTILIGFCQDIWHYVSIDYIKQIPVAGEVGSSTMPQKVNPIDFEQAEGNLIMANGLFETLSRKLPISRMQRDLSDSTVKRFMGMALTTSYLSYSSIIKGLNKLYPNEEKLKKDLEDNWEIVSEGVQTILRSQGFLKPYELLKEFTRGKRIDKVMMENFIDGLEVNKCTKEKLKKVTPFTYVGLAVKLARIAVKGIK